jgi:hypothetical protein
MESFVLIYVIYFYFILFFDYLNVCWFAGYKTVELTEEQKQRRQQRAKKRRQQAQEKREHDKVRTTVLTCSSGHWVKNVLITLYNLLTKILS